jgi:DNA-directed RNA polymerase III subunit RPC1
LSAQDIAIAIKCAPKLKIEDVSYIKNETIVIRIPRVKNGNSNTFILMQNLKRVLPFVVINGIPTAARAIIHDNHKESRLELQIDGYGLADVMGKEGFSKLI